MGHSEQVSKPTDSARILVAEDDEAVGMYIEAVLLGEGYQVVRAGDGLEAVSKYGEEGPFALAILDIHMPALDGRGALERIRGLDASVCALVLSGMPVEEAGCLPDWAQGFDGFLSKPFEAADLVKAVGRLLGARLRNTIANKDG